MFQIEPIEEVITRRKVMVTLDEDEIAKVLVDPREFQKALRAQKTAWNGHRSVWSATGHANARRAAKKATRPKAAEKKMTGVKCPKCHKVFKKLGRHVASCTGNRDPLASALPSALEE